jgi:hypothetical protein
VRCGLQALLSRPAAPASSAGWRQLSSSSELVRRAASHTASTTSTVHWLIQLSITRGVAHNIHVGRALWCHPVWTSDGTCTYYCLPLHAFGGFTRTSHESQQVSRGESLSWGRAEQTYSSAQGVRCSSGGLLWLPMNMLLLCASCIARVARICACAGYFCLYLCLLVACQLQLTAAWQMHVCMRSV